MAKIALKKCSFRQKLHFSGAILVVFGRDAFWGALGVIGVIGL